MNQHFYMDSCFMIVLMITVCILAIDIQFTSARQCYVCGIGPTDPLYSTVMLATGTATEAQLQHNKTHHDHDAISALGCFQFTHIDADLNALLVECPAGYKGCFSQTDATGLTTIRTCNRYSIDDCKTANRVTYCYCTTDRCNGHRPATLPVQQQLTSASSTSSSTTSTTTVRPQPKLQHPIFRNSEYNDDDEDTDDEDDDRDEAFEASGNSDLNAEDDEQFNIPSEVSTTEQTTVDDFDMIASNATSLSTSSSPAVPAVQTATESSATKHHNHRYNHDDRSSSSSSAPLSSRRWTIFALTIPNVVLALSRRTLSRNLMIPNAVSLA